MNDVLDACAMIAFLAGEAGSSVVKDALTDPSGTCHAHSLNLCEVYYHFLRHTDEATARRAIDDLRADGVTECSEMSRPFWEEMGRLKTRGRISLADCACLVLAIRLSGRVLTTDHHEFEPLVPLEFCPIMFIR